MVASPAIFDSRSFRDPESTHTPNHAKQHSFRAVNPRSWRVSTMTRPQRDRTMRMPAVVANCLVHWRRRRSPDQQLWRSVHGFAGGGWILLLTPASSFVLMVGLTATLVAKAITLLSVQEIGLGPTTLMWAGGKDAAVYGGLVAVLSLGETRRWVRILTWPLALATALIALVNALTLPLRGQQLVWEEIATGISVFGDLWLITAEFLKYQWPLAVIVGTLTVAVAAIARRRFRSMSRSFESRRLCRERARYATCIAGLGVLSSLILPPPANLGVQDLGANAAIQVYRTWLTAASPDSQSVEGPVFTGFHPSHVLSTGDMVQLSAGPRPNIVLLLLESTRFDHTELSDALDWKGTKTPYLRALAGRFQGVVATRPRWCESSSSLKASDGVLQPRVFRGRRLSVVATAAMSLALCLLRSVPLGKYWRSKPLVFSFVPRCHGLRGSQKNTCSPVSIRS